jgi:hypothetical protein
MKTKITFLPEGKIFINPMSGGLSDPSCKANLSFLDDISHCLTGCNGVTVMGLPNSGNLDECVEIGGELYRPLSGTYSNSDPVFLNCSAPNVCYDGCTINYAFQTYTIPDNLILKGSDIVIPINYSPPASSGLSGESNPVFDDVIYAISTPWQCTSGGSGSASGGTSGGSWIDNLPECDCCGNSSGNSSGNPGELINTANGNCLDIPDDVTGSNYTGGCYPVPCRISGSYFETGPISTYANYAVGSVQCYGCPIEAIVDAPLGGTAWNLIIEGCGVTSAVQGGGQGYYTWTGSQYDQSYYCSKAGGGGGPSVPIAHPISKRYADPFMYGKGFNKSK